MAYNQTPDLISAAYRPMRFRVVRTSTSKIKRIKVELTINNVKKDTFYVDPISNSNNDYFFEFDIHTLIQAHLGPDRYAMNSAFEGIGLGGASLRVDPSLFVKYKLTNYTVTEGTDGLLTVNEIADVSNDLYAVSASPSKVLNGQLTRFSFVGPKIIPLTLGNQFIVGKTEDHLISFLGHGITHMCVVWGSGSAYAQVNDSTSQYAKWNVGCGPGNLSKVGWIMTSGGTFPSDWSAIKEYFVFFGVPNNSWLFNVEERTERIHFKVQERCGLRLYWINRLGGVDQFTFQGNQITSENGGGQELPISGNWATASPRMNPATHETIRLNSISNNEIAVTDVITDDEAKWVKEVATSPEIYAVVDGQLTAVQIANGSFRIDDAKQYQVEVSFTVLFDSIEIQSM